MTETRRARRGAGAAVATTTRTRPSTSTGSLDRGRAPRRRCSRRSPAPGCCSPTTSTRTARPATPRRRRGGARGLTLLDAGLPLGELLDLGRRTDEAVRSVADHAVEAFLRFVRDPVRGTAATTTRRPSGWSPPTEEMLPGDRAARRPPPAATAARRGGGADRGEPAAGRRGDGDRSHRRVLDDDRPLLDLPPPVDGTSDASPGSARRGPGRLGDRARLEPGPGATASPAPTPPPRPAADAEVVDDESAPGTGLVAVGSFTFDDDAAGRSWSCPGCRRPPRRGDLATTIDPPAHAGAGTRARTRRRSTPPRDRPRYAGSSNPDLHWLEAVADRGRPDPRRRARQGRARPRPRRVVPEPFDPLDLARRLTAGSRAATRSSSTGWSAPPRSCCSPATATGSSRGCWPAPPGRSATTRPRTPRSARRCSRRTRTAGAPLAADSVRRCSAPRCRDLTDDPEPRLLRLDNVQHLATTFEGRLDGPTASRSRWSARCTRPRRSGGTPRDARWR
jgi:menaquinone-specific isochorismate synthase